MNEAETRADHIDPALKAAGWGVVDGSRIRREYSITHGRIESHGRRGKPLIAEYVLEYSNSKLGVVEAKAATRTKLLDGLSEKGFGKDQMKEMQKIIDAEKSDLFDVLAYIAYALPTLSREERAAKAKVEITTHFNTKQQVFLDFVLSHYVSGGVEELSQKKLTPLLRLKYSDSIADAVADLGPPDEIGKIFGGFQKFLYLHAA